jgi:ABC-2 type transport system ATP-binding protein
MDEAQRLADRVAIIKSGRIVAQGVPEELLRRRSADAVIAFGLPDGVDRAELPAGLSAAPADRPGGRLELRTSEPVRDLALLCGWASERGLDLPGIEVTRPSLEDVYLELTA